MAAAAGLLAATVPLRAHHALTAEYDPKKKITLSGTITRLEWSNPHTFLSLDVTPAPGKTEIWRIEVGSPKQLLSVKLTRDMLAVGATVVIEGLLAKDGSKKAAGTSLTMPGHTTTFLLMAQIRKPNAPVNDPLARATPYFFAAVAPLLVLLIGLLVLRRQQALGAPGAKAE